MEQWLEKLKEVAPYSTAVVSLKEAVLKAKGEEGADVLEQLLTKQVGGPGQGETHTPVITSHTDTQTHCPLHSLPHSLPTLET